MALNGQRIVAGSALGADCAHVGIAISVQPRDKMTLPVYDLPLQFVYAQPAE